MHKPSFPHVTLQQALEQEAHIWLDPDLPWQLTCPADTEHEVGYDDSGYSVPRPTTTPNISISSDLTINGAAEGTLRLGLNTLSYTVRSTLGEEKTCSFTVTVSRNRSLPGL